MTPLLSITATDVVSAASSYLGAFDNLILVIGGLGLAISLFGLFIALIRRAA